MNNFDEISVESAAKNRQAKNGNEIVNGGSEGGVPAALPSADSSESSPPSSSVVSSIHREDYSPKDAANEGIAAASGPEARMEDACSDEHRSGQKKDLVSESPGVVLGVSSGDEISGGREQSPATSSIPSPAAVGHPKEEGSPGDGEREDGGEGKLVDQLRIFPGGPLSDGRFGRRQSSTRDGGASSEIEDFHSARMTLGSVPVSRSGSKNSSFLGDLPRKSWQESQPRYRNPESDRRALLRGLELLRDRLADPYGQEVKGRPHHVGSSRQTSVSGYSSEITVSGRRAAMGERYPPYQGSPSSPGMSSGSNSIHGSFGKRRQHHQKRHCRPISGGAPFVLCNFCMRLLQLPVDFLVSRGRRHKLRCGACSQVLVFFFHGGGHIQEEDPVSFSDEFGPPVSKSYSTNGEPAAMQRRGKQHEGFPLHRLMGYPSARDVIYQPCEEDDHRFDFYDSYDEAHFLEGATSRSPEEEDDGAQREIRPDKKAEALLSSSRGPSVS